jgi:heme oxygenase (biliverdin-IX-beta and delta-forming)
MREVPAGAHPALARRRQRSGGARLGNIDSRGPARRPVDRPRLDPEQGLLRGCIHTRRPRLHWSSPNPEECHGNLAASELAMSFEPVSTKALAAQSDETAEPTPRAPMPVLRVATAHVHTDAERRVRILDTGADLATYAHYLSRMLGFHEPVEHLLAANATLAQAGFEATARSKQAWLRADLEALGIDPARVPRWRGTVAGDPGDPARAVGIAYVLEGSTLGGRFLLAHLNPELAAQRGRATRFLEGYGDRTGAMWKRFGAIATELLATDHALDVAVAAARSTFVELTQWLGGPDREPPFPRPRRQRNEGR